MSVVLTLTSCAIIAGLSITQTAAMALVVKDDDELEENINEGLETQFVDSEILIKTLQGFDCHFEQIDENQINVQTTCGNLIYKRDAVGEAFKLYMDEINDVDGLVQNIRSFEFDYGRNVQAYTYDHIKKNLTDDMTIVEDELLDDDSLYLTINID
ncbi:MAG: hypothetical protein IJ077_07360 [Eubacterium sp.]|nr:hypothetical protein [Eubacterium sp.]MBR1530885.1 hypothetical protein [Eubacterium sp.]MBR2278515.1 hypothetical protein [Eubacterium sp.]